MLKFLKKLIIAVIALMILVSIVLAIPATQRGLRDYVLRRISASTQSIIRIGNIQGGFSRQVILENVEFKTADFYLACRRISFKYHPYLLFWGYVNIDELESSDLKIKVSAHRAAPAAKIPSPAATVSYFKFIDVNQIDLAAGELKLEQPDGQVVLLENINLKAALYYDVQRSIAKLDFSNLGFICARPLVSVLKSSGEIVYTPQDLRLAGIKIKLPQSNVSMDGYLRDFSSPQVYFKLMTRPLVLTDLGLSGQSAGIKPLKLDLAAAGKLSRLNCSLKLNCGQSEISWHGWVDLTAPQDYRYSLNGEIKHLNLPDFALNDLGETDLNLKINGEGEHTREQAHSGDLEVLGDDSYFGPYQIFPSQLNVHYADGLVTLAGNLINTNFGHFTLKSQFGPLGRNWLPEAGNLTMAFDQFNVKSVLKNVYLGSNLNGELALTFSNLHGTDWKKAEVSTRLSLLPSNFSKIKINKLDLKASWRGQKLDVENITLESDLAQADIKGVVDYNGQTDLHAWIKVQDLSLLRNVFPDYKMTGQISVDGKVTGETSDLQADWYVNGTHLKYKQYHLSKLGWHGFYQDKKLSYELSLTANADQNIELSGSTDLRSSPAITTIDLLKVQYLDQLWTNAKEFTVKTDPRLFAISDLVLGNRGQLLRARGTLDWQGPLDFNFSLENIQLDTFNQSFFAESQLNGTLNSFISITGTAANPQLKARIETAGLELKPVCFTTYELNLELINGWWKLQGQANCAPQEALVVDGSLYYPVDMTRPLPDIWQSQLDLKIQLQKLPIDFLRNFFPVLSQAQGYTDTTLEAHGKLGDPDISLNALSNNCRLQIKGLPDLFTAIKIKATTANNKVSLDYLTLLTKQGEVNLTGTGQLQNLKLTDFNLAYKIRNGPAFYPDICTATVDADGIFKRENGEYNITAAIDALEGTVEIKESEQDNKSDIVYVDDSSGGEAAARNEAPPETFADHLTLDIKIHADGNVWYKQDTSKAEVMGDLRLLKDPKKPIAYLGSINIKQGYYDFLRNRFVITRGDLQFPGTPGFNPLLNIDGEYTEMSEMKIMATVRGDLHNPQIQLTSDPPQKDVEILSFLLFGKSSTNLTPQEQASVETQVLGFIGRSTVLKVRDILGSKLTIDTLDIKKEEKTGDWRVSVGKYLGRKLFVAYTFGFSADAEDKLRLEYKLGRRWSVESEISQKHSAGADLFWAVDY